MSTLRTVYDRTFHAAMVASYVTLSGLLLIGNYPILPPLIGIALLYLVQNLQKREINISLLLGNVAVIGLIALGFYLRLTDDVFDMLTYILIVILLIKLAVLRTIQDYLWVMLVLFFLNAATAISTTGMEFIPFLALSLFCLFRFCILWNRKRVIERCVAYTEEQNGRSQNALAQFAIEPPGAESNDTQTPTSRRTGQPTIILGLVALCMVLGGIIFFLIPRYSTSAYIPPVRISMPSMANQGSTTGFGDTVDLDSAGTDIEHNMEIVMYAKPQNKNPNISLRLRAVSLDTFDGKRWRRSTAMSPDSNMPALSTIKGDHTEFSIIQNPSAGRYLFAPSFAQRLIPPRGFVMMYDGNAGVSYIGGNRPIGRDIRYTAISVLDTPASRTLIAQTVTSQSAELAQMREYAQTHTQDVLGYSTEYIEMCRAFPDFLNRQRWENLLVQWNVPADSFEAALAIERRLKTDFSYSLKTGAVQDGENPVEWFLFQTRTGHCEYFASAMALMLRSRGIPARLVNGFASSEWNSSADTYVVRQSDAHSWVEVYFDGVGWASFDATPDGGIARRPEMNAYLRRLSNALDAARLGWYRNVIDFDMRDQPQWIRGLDRIVATAFFAPQNLRNSRSQFTFVMWESVIFMALGVIGVCIGWRIRQRIAALFRPVVQFCRRHFFRVDPTNIAACTVEPYRNLLRALWRKFKLSRFEKETPLEFAKRVTKKNPETLHAFPRLTMLYYRLRYGGRKPTADEQKAVEDATRQMSRKRDH